MTDTRMRPASELRAVNEPDDSPYRERRYEPGFDKTPWSAHFFYFGPEVGGQRRFDRYFYASQHGPIERENLGMLITQLALNARLADRAEQVPAPHPNPTAKSEWKRKSYLIALVDDPTFSFTADAAISVDSSGGRTPNHSFFDAKDFNDIELPALIGGTQTVSAVCVIDHMKKANGEDLAAGDEEEYVIRFNPDPIGFRFNDGEDDGGKNVGPPVPPPA